MRLRYGASPYLLHNTIVGNASAGVIVTASATITNGILWGNGSSGDLVGASATYSDIGTGETEGEGNISEDPQFVGEGDYHLRDTSPCIDRGTNDAPDLPGTDIDGQPRLCGSAADMGADEVFPPLQPDLWVSDGIFWAGINVYNDDGLHQTVSLGVMPGNTLVYRAALQNDGEETEHFWIKGPAGDENWTVRYYWRTVVREDREVTDKVTGPTGWKNRDVLAGEKRSFLITVTLGSGAGPGTIELW